MRTDRPAGLSVFFFVSCHALLQLRPAMSGNPRIKDMAEKERPRERLMMEGADALSGEDLIAILLRTGRQGYSAIDIARQLLAQFRSLDRLATASIEDLCGVKGVGRDKAVTLKAAFTLARRMARELQLESPLLDTPDRVAELLREENRTYEVERFQVLLLNTRRRLIRVERLSQGTLDTLLVHPRDVFKLAIAANASALILAHNHPSGDPAPSEADVKVTRDLIRAGQLLKIEVLDHIILGRRSTERSQDYVSLRELGYFYS
jgi:DNA repair protein RadC